MTEYWKVALGRTEKGKDLYILFWADNPCDLTKYKYFNNRRKALAEARRLNILEENMNDIFGKDKK